MQLDRLSAVLRPRNAWEAIDLGLAMARRHFLQLWLLWWLSALPVTLLTAVLLYRYPGFISSAVWWFKPLFEPILVYWLSRALFDDVLPLRDAGKAWWPVTRRRLIANLSWRRLSANRSFFLPITILEQPDRHSWRRRAALFRRDYSGGTWLTVVGVHFEAVLGLGLVLGIVLLIPTELLPDWDWLYWFDENNTLMAWASSAASILAMSLIAPFYVGAGFALYLSRRTDLEAWDLELTLRGYTQRLAPVALALLLTCATVVTALSDAEAATSGDARTDSAQRIEAVLADPVFGRQETTTRWKLDFDSDDEGRQGADLDISWLSDALELLAWMAVALLVAWLIVRAVALYRRLQRTGDGSSAPHRPTTGATVAHTDAAADLPDDIPAAVNRLLEQDDPRAAVALLYRASLASLVGRYALELSDSATEGECLARVRSQRPEEESDEFAELTRTWVGVAYADQVPPPTRVAALLEAWQRRYAAVTGPVA